MRISDILRRLVRNSDSSAQSLSEAVEGIANQSDLINRKLSDAVNGIANQNDLLKQVLVKMDSLIELQKAEIVMQREQAEAADELATLLGPKNNL